MVTEEFPGVRPQALARSRSDNSQRVEGGTNVNTANVRLRSELAVDESRLTFALVGDHSVTQADPNPFPHVQPPLASGESRSLVFLEGYQQEIAAIEGDPTPTETQTAIDNNQGKITPPPGVNAVTTTTALSATGPIKIKPYVDDNLQSAVYDSGDGFQFAQIAELSEIKEFANLLGETLADPPTIRWEIENLSPDPVELSIIIRLLGKEVESA